MRLQRIFIANRGEIVARVARTAAVLGIETVAPVARATPPRFLAQEVTRFCYIEQETADFYLDAEQLIALAHAEGCDALHPGYGFLAEQAAFAEKVTAAGLTWIGPAAETIAQMGDKHRARQVAANAGVAVVPGVFIAEELSDAELQKITKDFCAQHGLPVIVKAVAGGGGKGMRVVHAAQQLSAAVQATAREARTLYRQAAVLVEKFIATPRHIEVQIVGDRHGQLVVLGARECSVQRRFQKIIEEAPAQLAAAAQQGLHAAAQRLGTHVAYYSTGTVEFLLDAEHGEFYFLEMNTRLQVEHTVTEEVFAIDLVALQLRVAAGERLDCTQLEPLTPRGHSIQARIYAEDASRDFMPAPGHLRCFQPYHGPGIRWEIGCDAPSAVSPFFDPLLAKLIATAADRQLAISRLQQALARTFIAGVHTDLALLHTVLAHQDFQAAQLTVNFIAQHLPQLLQTTAQSCNEQQARREKIAAALLADTTSGDRALQHIFRKDPADSDIVMLRCIETPAGQYGCGIYAAETFFQFVRYPQADKLCVTVHCDGHLYTATTAAQDWQENSQPRSAQALTAPVPGRVAAVNVKADDTVNAGTVCVVIESMKMEFALKAEGRGRVQRVTVASGDLVSDGQTLVIFAQDIARDD